MSEEWRDVVGYEGLYEVSNMGRVKSLERKVPKGDGERTVKERFLKPGVVGGGYLKVVLCDGGKRKMFFVHRLVCQAFHDNPENKPCVNHIDENKTNNAASNIEWCTTKENNNHRTRNERAAKNRSKSVGQYTLGGELVKIWPSPTEVHRQLGINQSNISAVARGERNKASGFIWKYV